ncbi:MAG: CPBP family intramembrane metalloprotease [Ruminococcaceae bacterium]|nr:CPBP family intramembrane metalloprotease [Oscillospiraceae bacterium]
MKRKAFCIVLSICLACLAMALVETVFQPGYLVKSAIKAGLFLGTVLYFGDFRGLFRREGLAVAAGLGAGIYGVILLAFFLFRPFIDLASIAAGLLGKEGVSAENFLWVALYISVVNSLLEELLFRGLGYLGLREHTSEPFAMVFSAAAFAAYHVAILDGWFSWWVCGLCLAGLFVGGLIFNLLDRRGGILPSWLAHGAANLAINTIGLMMFGLVPS